MSTLLCYGRAFWPTDDRVSCQDDEEDLLECGISDERLINLCDSRFGL